jgi:tripartite ATP-independent transporter DctM subunit
MVLYGGLSHVSIGRLLIAGAAPGIVFAVLCSIYIVVVAILKPQAFGGRQVEEIPVDYRKLVKDTVVYGLPLFGVVFAVVGTIYTGVATPSEAAALGSVAAIIVTVAYRQLNLAKFKKAAMEAAQLSAMIFFIVVGSLSFSNLLALTGATQHLLAMMAHLTIPPLVIILIMLAFVLIMGCFIDVISIMFITLPVYNPLIESLGVDPLWFGILYMICIALGSATPPFGVNLFTVKGVSPPDILLEDVYRGVLPFVIIAVLSLPLFILVPEIITWLPNRMLG